MTKEISRPSAPWLNDDLRRAMQKRDDVSNRLKRDRFNVSLQQQYRNEKKLMKSLIMNTKKSYYVNRLHE